MKKRISIILLLVLILSNTIVFAAPGDVIYTGNPEKVYRKGLDEGKLAEDILNGADVNNFYREIDTNDENNKAKFIKIVDEEKSQLEYLKGLFERENIKDPAEIQKYVIKNEDKLRGEFNKITQEKAMSFDKIGAKMSYEQYLGSHNALELKTPDNYSTPEPGFKESSTKIAKLKLPNGANKWKVQIVDKEIPAMPKDTILKDAMDYVSGRDIDIEVGKYLVLYAVDYDNKIKAFANIKITESMIKIPRELAPKIEIGELSQGEKYAGAVIITKLNELPKGATKWQTLISPIPVERVYKTKMADAIDYKVGEDLIIAKENELHPISSNFKKYLLLLAVDNEGLVQAYNSFEIGKDNMSKAPSLLRENTNYKGPVAGDHDGTTKFNQLHFGLNPDENMKDAKTWKAMISKSPISTPKLGTDAPGTVLSASSEISANVGDYLLLTAVDEKDKIKGYRIIHLTENMVKGQTAPMLTEGDNYSKPEKGSIEGTTRINNLNTEGVGNTKWMYKIGENLVSPVLGKTVSGALDYVQGQNAKASVGEDFLLLATDVEGKVKAFAKIKLDENMIKDPAPLLLREGVNYIGPVKGEKPGTTKFDALSGSDSIGHNIEWMYLISNEEPEIPELNSTIQGATEFKSKESIGKDLKSGKYLMLLATDSGKVKGYAIFRLNDTNIKMPPATPLVEGEHYSTPERGTGAGTTKISKLQSMSIDGVDQWRIKISPEPFLKAGEEIEFNSIIPQANIYGSGNNIRANPDNYILLLTTDYNGRIKAYTQIQLKEENIRKANATLLISGTNYTEPDAGTVENSTRFTFLDTSTNIVGATKWMYKIGPSTFGPIELDSIVEDALPAGVSYKVGENIENVSVGDCLLLVATDKDGKVKGYKEFILAERHIRGGKARLLDENNYKLQKGNKPGTTKFSKLVPLGMEGNIRWKYKLINKELPENEKPYLNSIIEDGNFVAVGQDIEVKEVDSKYGYLLLLATDYSNKTKGYAEIQIDSTIVKEHPPTWNVKLEKGGIVDSVKITGELPNGANNTKYIRSYREIPQPAFDEILENGIPYNLGEDIPQVRIGEYLGIYAVDKDNQIKAFNSFEITANDIKQGSASMTNAKILEGSINNGGEKIEITLKDAKWASDLKTNAEKRQALYSGFKADGQAQEWSKVVASLVKDGSGAIDISEDRDVLTISLPYTNDYDISTDQKITLVVPASAIEGAINPIEATGEITIKPTVKAHISGDVVNSIVREKDLKAGGKTIVIELKDGDWIGDIGSKDNIPTLIGGFKVMDVDDQSHTNWYEIARKIQPENVVRNSSKKLTITLPKVENINFAANKETISLTIAEALIQGTETEVVATPTFTLYPDVLQIKGEIVEDKNKVILMAPDYRIVDNNKDTWVIDVKTGSLKDDINNNDVIISGLPRGLKANTSKVKDKNQIEIKISDTASSTLANNMDVKVKIKGTAVKEPNSIDSEDILCKLIKGDSLIEDLKKVEIDVANNKLINTSSEMEYSINSNSENDANWSNCSEGTETMVTEKFGPGRVYIRDKNNPKVIHLVSTLNYPKAPIGVKVSEVVYDSNGMNFKLGIPEENASEYEISINGGKDWQKLNLSNAISLPKESDLRIRYSATSSSLHSLDTKINILDLSNVDIDVAKGTITKTTTAMEYSLDGESFSSSSTNETSVKFVKGSKVIVRERSNPINSREIKTVGIEASPSGNISYNISGKSINATNINKLEYRIGNDPWKNLSTDNKEIEFKPGKVQVRAKSTQYNVASEPVDVGELIKEPASKPELKVDDFKKDIIYWNGTDFIKLEDANTLEYKINDGDWKANTNWTSDKETDLIKNTNANISLRVAATENTLPSQTTIISFTGNLTFENVKLNVVDGKIEGTTSAMEYSINSSNGKDGSWIDAKPDSTSVDFTKDMKVYIREKSKPLNFKLIGTVGMEEKLNEDLFEYNILLGTITNKDTRILEYKIDNENWKGIHRGSADNPSIANVEFKPGKLQFRARGTETTLPSPIITKDIKAKASAPELRYDDVNYKIEKIGTSEGENYEYSINDGNWIGGTVNTQFEGGNIIRIRIVADNHTLPSEEQFIAFSPNLNLNNVVLNVGQSKLMNTSTSMEYTTNSTNGENGTWISCNEKETILKLKEDGLVYIREKKKPRNIRKVTTEKIVKKSFKKGPDFIKDNIDYNILQATISINKPTTEHQEIVNDLQYRINNGNWVNIDYVVLENNISKVLAYNVNFVSGNLEFRLRGDENTLPSDSILKEVIKAPASVPNVSVGFDSNNYRNKVIIPKGIEIKNLEYSLTGDKGPWTDGEYLSSEDLVGKVYIRTKATENTLPSLVKELTFSPTLNLKTINLSTHVQPLELNGTTTQMEYRVNNMEWKKCDNGNTKLIRMDGSDLNDLTDVSIIEIRDSKQPDNKREVYKK